MIAMEAKRTLKPTDPTVEREVNQLAAMPIVSLRKRYKEVFRSDPPEAFGPDLLRRSIAHRIQEKAYGSLSRSAQRLLDQLVKAYTTKGDGKLVLPRRIKPGSVLVRQWKGQSYRVKVTADGFEYDRDSFSNLSEIAGIITGTHWNGPRFFGLRSKASEGTDPASPGSLQAKKPKVDRSSRRSVGGKGGRRASNVGESGSKGGRDGR